MIRPSYQLVERGDDLLIGVRFLRPAAAALMLSVLVLFWSFIFYISGQSAPLLVVMCITGAFALLIAFYTSWISIKPDLVTTYSSPIPIDRKTREPSEIQEIFCTLVRAATGRGASERYALMANTRSSSKPVTILYGFVKEEDAAEAGRMLTDRLNARRPPGISPVAFLRN